MDTAGPQSSDAPPPGCLTPPRRSGPAVSGQWCLKQAPSLALSVTLSLTSSPLKRHRREARKRHPDRPTQLCPLPLPVSRRQVPPPPALIHVPSVPGTVRPKTQHPVQLAAPAPRSPSQSLVEGLHISVTSTRKRRSPRGPCTLSNPRASGVTQKRQSPVGPEVSRQEPRALLPGEAGQAARPAAGTVTQPG